MRNKKFPLLKRKINLKTKKEFLEDLEKEVSKVGYPVIADKLGISRTSIYKTFGADKRPYFITIWKMIDALGYSFKAVPKKKIKR